MIRQLFMNPLPKMTFKSLPFRVDLLRIGVSRQKFYPEDFSYLLAPIPPSLPTSLSLCLSLCLLFFDIIKDLY